MISIIASSAPGLSPLARGTLYTRILCAVDRRFIPAGAGNTCGTLRLVLNHSVYPRWRGEHHKPPIFPITAAGLSPLARGTPNDATQRQKRRRFIPAGAGNTHLPRRVPADHAVYPRWRGEHTPKHKPKSRPNGLSPLARGTRSPAPTSVPARRFIPAGAGNTCVYLSREYIRAVYPRWRGEHQPASADLCATSGLSPLARGTHIEIVFGIYSEAVYPRWRGEHCVIPSLTYISISLSPLARGTPTLKTPLTNRIRFIPAGAGNTFARPSFSDVSAVYPRWRGEHTDHLLVASPEVGLSPLARGTH